MIVHTIVFKSFWGLFHRTYNDPTHRYFCRYNSNWEVLQRRNLAHAGASGLHDTMLNMGTGFLKRNRDAKSPECSNQSFDNSRFSASQNVSKVEAAANHKAEAAADVTDFIGSHTPLFQNSKNTIQNSTFIMIDWRIF